MFSTFLFLYILFIFAIYLQTQMNISMLMPLTLDRVLFQASGYFLPIIFETLYLQVDTKKY